MPSDNFENQEKMSRHPNASTLCVEGEAGGSSDDGYGKLLLPLACFATCTVCFTPPKCKNMSET